MQLLSTSYIPNNQKIAYQNASTSKIAPSISTQSSKIEHDIFFGKGTGFTKFTKWLTKNPKADVLTMHNYLMTNNIDLIKIIARAVQKEATGVIKTLTKFDGNFDILDVLKPKFKNGKLTNEAHGNKILDEFLKEYKPSSSSHQEIIQELLKKKLFFSEQTPISNCPLYKVYSKTYDPFLTGLFLADDKLTKATVLSTLQHANMSSSAASSAPELNKLNKEASTLLQSWLQDRGQDIQVTEGLSTLPGYTPR